MPAEQMARPQPVHGARRRHRGVHPGVTADHSPSRTSRRNAVRPINADAAARVTVWS